MRFLASLSLASRSGRRCRLRNLAAETSGGRRIPVASIDDGGIEASAKEPMSAPRPAGLPGTFGIRTGAARAVLEASEI